MSCTTAYPLLLFHPLVRTWRPSYPAIASFPTTASFKQQTDFSLLKHSEEVLILHRFDAQRTQLISHLQPNMCVIEYYHRKGNFILFSQGTRPISKYFCFSSTADFKHVSFDSCSKINVSCFFSRLWYIFRYVYFLSLKNVKALYTYIGKRKKEEIGTKRKRNIN